jgi:type VI secretion system (T6SS) effector TldE1-like protein
MTFGTERRASYSRYDHRRLPPNALPQRLLGGAAAVFTAALCAWTACGFVGSDTDRADVAISRGDKPDIAVRGDRLAMVSRRGDKLAVARPGASGWIYASLFDPHLSSDASATFTNDGSSIVRPVALTVSTPVAAANPIRPELAAAPARYDRAIKNAAALGLRAPATRSPAPRVATAESTTEPPGFFKGIFEKLFGKPAPTTLAYAATDDAGLAETKSIGGRYDRYTAVYDISARVVYMPDGTRLEAHSGLGSRLDDPRFAGERMHGVTPPNVYDLELREAPFHGVRALRMIPEDETKTFGRSGLLAHTYMLGPNGDSNGCVSFKNYDAFLQAYLNQKVKRLAVVARLD